MQIKIQQENPENFVEISDVIKQAFRCEIHSDHQEQFLVERIRKTEAYVPELSLVAIDEESGRIVGFIMMSVITIGENNHLSLALAPVAVLPEDQNRGIGGMLIREVHDKAIQMGYDSVVLLGHKDYYPRFGYKMLSGFSIKLPFDVPDEFCMAVELKPNALHGVTGVVKYSEAFDE